MKNTIRFFGIIALAALIGFSMAGCSSPTSNDDNSGVQPAGDEEVLTSPISSSRTLGIPYGQKNYVYNGSTMLHVNNNAVLTILPGTTIRFSNAGGGIEFDDSASLVAAGLPKLLDIHGNVIKVGNVELDGHIKFIGGNSKGSWVGVWIEDSVPQTMEYVDILNAGNDSAKGAVWLSGDGAGVSTLSMDYCTIDGAKYYGLCAQGDATISSFSNNKISNCNIPVIVDRPATLVQFDGTSDLTVNTQKYVLVNNGIIYSNMTLNAATVPYQLHDHLNINVGYTLTVNSGVTFWLESAAYIFVGGTINATGVTFTRPTGSTFYWGYITFNGNGNTLTNCTIEYGGSSSPLLNFYSYSGATFTNTTVRNLNPTAAITNITPPPAITSGVAYTGTITN